MVGTTAGMARYDGSRFGTIRSAETPGLGGDRIQALPTDRRGRTWVGVDSAPPSILESGEIRMACDPQTLTSVHQILESDSGDVWLTGHRLAYASGDKLEVAYSGGALPMTTPEWITEDLDGEIWAATLGGVFRGGKAGFERVDWRPCRWVTTGFDGSIWVLTTDGDLVPLTGDSDQVISFGTIRMRQELARSPDRRLVISSKGLYSMGAGAPDGTGLSFELTQDFSRGAKGARKINCLLPAGDADLWMGTNLHGLEFLQRRYVTLKPLVPGNAPEAELSRALRPWRTCSHYLAEEPSFTRANKRARRSWRPMALADCWTRRVLTTRAFTTLPSRMATCCSPPPLASRASWGIALCPTPHGRE